MSHIANALDRLFGYVSDRMDKAAPFRAVVSGTSGNRVLIHRPEAVTADAEPYAKATFDTFTNGDEVLCLPVNGKPVVLGRTNPTGNVPHAHDDRYYTETEVTALLAARQPRVLAGGAYITQTYSTAGDRVFTAAQVEFTGLTVGGTYNVEYTATFVASGTSGNASFGVQSTANGSSALLFAFGYGVPVTTEREHIAGYSTTRTVGSDGKITVAPVFRWNSGSVFIRAVYLTATVTAI